MSLQLQLGWMLEALPAKVPVNLRREGLAAHTAVIAQSGSGKSFMLGRLLEEVASKTRARVLILDPNSDFVKFGAVEAGAWENPRLKEWFDTKTDTLGEFRRRWQGAGFSVLTQRKQSSLALGESGAIIAPFSISWPELPPSEKLNCLGFSARRHPEECRALDLIAEGAELCLAHNHSPFDLGRWIEVAGVLSDLADLREELPISALGPYDKWPLVAVARHRRRVSQTTARRIFTHLRELQGAEIWDRTSLDGALPQRMKALCHGTVNGRIVCLDLGSMSHPEQRFLVASVALNAIWEQARTAWLHAMEKPAEEDSRCPVFIVIDEAHNLAPAQPTTDAAIPVTEALVRIAMEGRKYGLFLILVTQRPSRVNGNLLSQCDNLCLLRMSNPADVRLVEEQFGFVPSGWAERSLAFEKGQVLLSGTFVERPVYARVAPRRTVEGGRSLRDEVWTADPLPALDERPPAQEATQD